MKKIEIIKKNQTEFLEQKDLMNEKNVTEQFSNRRNQMEERISDLEDRNNSVRRGESSRIF